MSLFFLLSVVKYVICETQVIWKMSDYQIMRSVP